MMTLPDCKLPSTRFLPGLLLMLSVQGVFAANTIVSPEWLASRIDDPNLVLIHIGERETYRKGHIPGARTVIAHMPFSHPDSHHDDNLILEMPAVPQLQTDLESLGVSNNSAIVIYWSDDEITAATRVVFTLQWAGLGDRTHYLDGGLNAWKEAGYDVTGTVESPKKGTVTLSPGDSQLVDAAWVQENVTLPGIALVDARSAAYYDGVSESRGKEGHVPGAGSAPWTKFVDNDLRFKDPDAIRALLAEAGVQPDDTVVAYCHIGQYATAVLLAAHSVGHEVKLYDGAFQDWANRDLPVVKE